MVTYPKTRIALNCLKTIIVKYPKIQYLIVVPTDNLKDQWVYQLDEMGLGFNGGVVVINTASTHKFETDILIIDNYLLI